MVTSFKEKQQRRNQTTLVRSKKDYLLLFIGSAFGLGLAPFAPGTFGALFGIAIHLAIVVILPVNQQPYYIGASLVIISFLTVYMNRWAENYWQEEDPKHYVLDEVAGYLMVQLLMPYGLLLHRIIAGFVLFRIFDIVKIPPARQIDQKMNNGWGVLLDDLVSAVYAALTMYGLFCLLKWADIYN